MPAHHLLLTNGTGLVGQYLLRDLLTAGRPVAVLSRGRDGQDGPARVAAVVARWERDLGRELPRPVALAGDVAEPGLGLSTADRTWIAAHCGEVVHLAASLQFVGRNRGGEPWRTNLDGTRHLLDFCRRHGPRRLHHVSTAYVCGRRTGPVFEHERPDTAAGFRNDYERAKAEAECLVHDADWLDARTVLRPATIVGDSRTGDTPTFHAFYTYLQVVGVLCRRAPRDAHGWVTLTLRLPGTGREPRNLVPVDWVAAASAALILDGRHHGRTYHLAPARPTTLAELAAAIQAHHKLHGVSFVGDAGRPDGPSKAEHFFDTATDLYRAYWRDEPVFDLTHLRAALPGLPCPELTPEVYARLCAAGARPERPRRRHAHGGDQARTAARTEG
jgi:nucleoside-diphosphate-sugar epimerase